ncbi:MmcQ/YjbR family DNA-binding protein [Arthrobacter sp. H5]|uniref:MmcQ/YjbR family DNA-binding protein n=1 Tax=Arthrobacter sp. H5 TaxID=1267973 RepID=UPI00048250FB|nr:MmcQ/YjbR family DNA-binding protein [Arthrobacter sp. H5]
MANEDDVRLLALSLPATTERPSYGTSGYRVKDRLLARIHEEPGVLVLWRASVEEKFELIAADPSKFFTTPHYDGHPIVLARLAAMGLDELDELIREAWEYKGAPRTA